MVDFYNIKVENGILTALAVKATTGEKFDVKAKVDGSYHNCSDGEIKKATWCVVLEANKKGKYPEKTSVAWG